MDKEKEPVENVLLASCLRFREEDAQSVRCCLQAAVVLNNYRASVSLRKNTVYAFNTVSNIVRMCLANNFNMYKSTHHPA